MSDIEKAELKLQQAKEALKKARQKARHAERKKDTRRKIIIGGLILKRIKKDSDLRDEVMNLLVHAQQRDKDMFKDYDFKTTFEKWTCNPYLLKDLEDDYND